MRHWSKTCVGPRQIGKHSVKAQAWSKALNTTAAGQKQTVKTTNRHESGVSNLGGDGLTLLRRLCEGQATGGDERASSLLERKYHQGVRGEEAHQHLAGTSKREGWDTNTLTSNHTTIQKKKDKKGYTMANATTTATRHLLR